MHEINDFSRTLSGMPLEALFALVVLAAFGLAAYAISAVVSVNKGRRNGR